MYFGWRAAVIMWLRPIRTIAKPENKRALDEFAIT